MASEKYSDIRKVISSENLGIAREMIRTLMREGAVDAELYHLAASIAPNEVSRKKLLDKALEIDPFFEGLSNEVIEEKSAPTPNQERRSLSAHSNYWMELLNVKTDTTKTNSQFSGKNFVFLILGLFLLIGSVVYAMTPIVATLELNYQQNKLETAIRENNLKDIRPLA